MGTPPNSLTIQGSLVPIVTTSQTNPKIEVFIGSGESISVSGYEGHSWDYSFVGIQAGNATVFVYGAALDALAAALPPAVEQMRLRHMSKQSNGNRPLAGSAAG